MPSHKVTGPDGKEYWWHYNRFVPVVEDKVDACEVCGKPFTDGCVRHYAMGKQVCARHFYQYRTYGYFKDDKMKGKY